jgi:hypothetical protein
VQRTSLRYEQSGSEAANQVLRQEMGSALASWEQAMQALNHTQEAFYDECVVLPSGKIRRDIPLDYAADDLLAC